MSKEGRAILESTLGSLLGFDDGASDVLDHLLSIESLQDLLEYLSQLLGDATPEILEFVDNVGRYEREEPLTLAGRNDSQQKEKEDSKPVAKPKEATPQPKKQQQTSKNDALQGHWKQKQNKSRVPPPRKKSPPPKQPSNQKKNEAEAKQSNPKPSPKTEAPRIVEKSCPLRGKAKVVCGCFGTKHKSLTNCLYCGRISCIEEGYDFCPFCGLMVEEFKDGVHDNDRAWVQKERLLRFDREFARRTEIFDDQADYQAPSTWMTADERQHAEENQSKQIEALKRQKQTLNLDIL